MEIAPFDHSFHLTADGLAGDFGFEGGVNRYGQLVYVSDNPCLRGRGIVCLEFRKFHGAHDIGNCDEVEAWSEANLAEYGTRAGSSAKVSFGGIGVRNIPAEVSCRQNPVKSSTSSVCRL